MENNIQQGQCKFYYIKTYKLMSIPKHKTKTTIIMKFIYYVNNLTPIKLIVTTICKFFIVKFVILLAFFSYVLLSLVIHLS